MTARTNSVAHKVAQHFMKYPDAVPALVAEKFGASKSNVYTYRRRARAKLDGRETKVFFSKKTVDEVMKEPVRDDGTECAKPANGNGHTTYDNIWGQKEVRQHTTREPDSWVNHGTFLSRDEYRGYLRGRVVDLMRNGLQENFDEAMRCADKLTQLAKAEGQ